MRVVYTSDLHADSGPQNRALLEPLAARARQLAPDVFVVAGDLAETAAAVTASLACFATVPGRKLYLAGNHDLYVEAAAGSSRDKFERILPAAAAAAGFEYLGLTAVDCGVTTFVGVPGWWDYSWRDPDLDPSVAIEHYRAGSWRNQRAFDRGHVLWPGSSAERQPPGSQPVHAACDTASDEALAAEMLARLEAQLDSVPPGRPIVAVVHVLPFAALVQRGAFAACAFHDAYLGCERLGARLAATPQVRAVITGHLHRHADLRLGGIRVVARPVGNRRDPRADLTRIAHESLGILELD